MPNIKLIPPALPGGTDYCPANWQQAANDFFNGGAGQLPSGGNGFWFGDTAPTDPTSFPVWIRTAAGVPVFPSMWLLQNGVWVARHPVPAASSAKMIWDGTEASAWSFEGGDGTNNPATITTGPMWVVDHNYDGNLLAGTGLVPGSNPAINIATGVPYGTAQFTIIQDNLPVSMSYNLVLEWYNYLGGGAMTYSPWAVNAGPPAVAPNADITSGTLSLPNPTGGKQIQNYPPAIGMFVIKRTARVWVTVPY